MRAIISIASDALVILQRRTAVPVITFFLLLENGTGNRLILEDGSGFLLLEEA